MPVSSLNTHIRPAQLDWFFHDLKHLSDIGPKKAELLKKLAGPHTKHLLFLLPTGYINRKFYHHITEIENGETGVIKACVLEHFPPRQKRQPYRITMETNGIVFYLIFFNLKADYLQKKLMTGSEYIISGQIKYYKDMIQITHPDYIFSINEEYSINPYEPKYPLIAGLTQKYLRKIILSLTEAMPVLPEWQDPNWLEKNKFPSWNQALYQLHHPTSEQDIKAKEHARKRLAYDELFAHQLALALTRQGRKQIKGYALINKQNLTQKIIQNAGFEPTNAQKKVFQEISEDMASPGCMSRLLQGDVGSGKTFIAALSSAQACDCGVQTALMAPTEILARQLSKTLNTLFKQTKIRIECLTRTTKTQKKRQIEHALKTGEIDILCGTHTLFQDQITFKNLGLVIIDEQHRFGVSHRQTLTQKGLYPDLLVMTATPIPRTLALSTYGDLDLSRLDEKPGGRLPIQTKIFSVDKLDSILFALKNALNRKDRIYWVCPALEETEKIDLIAAEERARILKGFFGEERIGLLHGKMNGAEKGQIIDSFQKGIIQLLVATTIIEVGINIPDANIMIIEQAERFGLSQLHQLRGRVGRGTKQSSCLLLYKPPLSSTARERLTILRSTEDGFLIAEKDLFLRGSGDLIGVKQSGLPEYKIARLKEDIDLLNPAIQDAKLLIHKDPLLESERGIAARLLLYLFDRNSSFRRLNTA